MSAPPERPPAPAAVPPARLGLFSFPALRGSLVRRSPAPARRRRRRWPCAAIAAALLTHGGVAFAQPDAAPPPSAPATDRVAAFVAEAARRFGVPEAWIRAVMRVESGGAARAVSSRGAMGLMQLMPRTWSDLRLRYGLGADPYDPRDNITAGAAYLRELHDRYGASGVFAAYNAGPARYEEHLSTGRPLPAETRAYVAALAPSLQAGASSSSHVVAMVRAWTDASLFPQRAATAGAPPSDARSPHDSSDTAPVAQTVLAPQSEGLFARLSSLEPRP